MTERRERVAIERPERGRQVARTERGTGSQTSASWLVAWAGAVVGLVGGVVQFAKPIMALSAGSLVSGLLLVMEAALGLAAVAVVVVWRRNRSRLGGVLIAVGLLGVLMDAAGGGAPPRVIPGVAVVTGGVLARFAVPRDHARSGQQHRSGSSAVAGWAGEAVGWLAVAAQVAVLIPFLAIGLVAPGWAVLALYALWAALLALVLRLRRAHPFATLLVPPATFALMYALMMGAGRVLDWQA
ncbi:MAG: hypothetical protein M3O70_15375 [Actinomycetota bacterium]|nr:hypothetical protein [Actinomycetota bacterium]